MELKNFLNKLETLSVGTSYKPHKYILILTLLELLEDNEKPENIFYFNNILKDKFTKYFNIYCRETDRDRPYNPYFHLQSSGIWFLKVKKGREKFASPLLKVGGPSDIIDNFEYGYLSETVFNLFTDKNFAAIIRDKVIDILKDRGNLLENLVVLEEKEKYESDILNKSLFQHEEDAIEYINNYIKHLGKMINNIYLFDRQSNNYYEYDIIIVGHSGIYVVELKHWSGNIKVCEYNWVINESHYRRDPHKNNVFKSRILRGIYQHYFKTYPDVWVESVVVLTNPEAQVEGANAPKIAAQQNFHNPTFASISDFITYLNKKEGPGNVKLLSDQQIDYVINYLNSLNNPKPSLKCNVPGYETVEYVSQKPECVELIARSSEGLVRKLNRFRVFRTPHGLEPKDKERFKKKAYNTIDAISKIGDHPNINKVWVFKNDDGDIIEGSEWSEIGTLRDLIRKNKGLFKIETAFRICRGIALALDKAHQIGIIHRAVKPENILIINDIPKLMNFDLSYQVEENHITVITDLSKLKDDGYIAPEILDGVDIDEGTDFFDLGIIAYELLTGSRPFLSIREFLAQGGLLKENNLQKLSDKEVPDKTIDIIRSMVVADRNKRIIDIQKINSAFSTGVDEDQKEEETDSINAELQPGSKYDVYEIIERVGKGAEAQIYKANTLRQEQVAVKLFNKEIPLDRIISEAEITSIVKSAYVVSCDNKIGHWENDRFFIVLDFIEGESLREIIDRKETPDHKTFFSIAICLLEAVEAFHGHRDEEGTPEPFLHSDIKPGNIMITRDKRAVLIDCGIAGKPRIDIYQGTLDYVPPDSILGTDMKFSQDGDLFALGVTLWEWLYGRKPYNNSAVGDKPVIPEDISAHVPLRLREWLATAVATEASQRFATVEDMRGALIKSIELEDASAATTECEISKVVDPERIGYITEFQVIHEQLPDIKEHPTQAPGNDFVSYLNSLSSASAGNENAIAECQHANPLFKRILIKNPWIDFVYDKLVNERKNVVLTGNAGDGKTTIAFEMYKLVKGEKYILDPIEYIPDKQIALIKDMSELPDQKRKEILIEAMNSEKNKYLIVSNTGTLLQSFKGLRQGGSSLEDSELLAALEADIPVEVLDNNFTVINIGRVDSIKTAMEVFKRMLKNENWTSWENCKYHRECPVYLNIKYLQNHIDIVTERVALLYRRLYEYGVRLTMRQMTGHLAYSITAGRDCAGIMSMSQTALGNCLCGSLFFNRFFGDDGYDVVPEALQLLPVRHIRKENFGVILDPSFERETWLKGKDVNIETGDIYLTQKLEEKFKEVSSSARRQFRRMVYFFHPDAGEHGKRYLSTFLQSPMLIKYLDFSNETSKISPLQENFYRIRVLQVLQEFFTGVRLPEGIWKSNNLYITLNRRYNGSCTQMILADFNIGDFELFIKPTYTIEKNYNGVLYIRTKYDNVEMKLDLPFLDFVERRYEGEVAEELSAYYMERLECFKVELLNLHQKKKQYEEDALSLLKIGPNREFMVMKIRINNDSLEVLQ